MANKEILERTGLPSVKDFLIRKNLRWTGHLMRMSPDRLPKQVIYSQLSSGHRKRGRPRLRFKDTVKINLTLRDIKIDSWTSPSQQRDKWRATVKWWKQCLSHRVRQHHDDDMIIKCGYMTGCIWQCLWTSGWGWTARKFVVWFLYFL